MDSLIVQKELFKIIQSQNPKHNIADTIANILGIAKSGAYRRITGETILTLKELILLLDTFSISFDSLINPVATGFELPILSEPPRNMSEYLKGIEQQLFIISKYQNTKLYFTDFEFFYYMYVPELAAFKFYIWSRIVWRLEQKQTKPFNFAHYRYDKPLLDRIENIANLYGQIPSYEIWRGNLFDTTLQQIRHCLSAGLFENPQDALHLCGLLRGLINLLQKMLIEGQKPFNKTTEKAADISVWYNEIFESNSTIIADLGTDKYVYMAFDTPNIMVSRHLRTFEHSLDYFKQMQSFGLSLTDTNERNRHLCFSRLTRKIDFFEADIHHILSEKYF